MAVIDTSVGVRINAIQCSSCYAWFGLDAGFETQAREDGRSFHCPYCDASLSWSNSSENKRLRDELAKQKHATEQAKADRDYWVTRHSAAAGEVEHTTRRLNAHKGVVTKLKKRIGKGVCPCCHQKFKDLRDHMRAEHPDWNPEKGAEAVAAKSK